MKHLAATLPDTIQTARLLLRRWQPSDAPRLKAALDASVSHLEPWIPWHVAEPATIDVLETRLAGHAADFDAGRAWIYGIFAPSDERVLGAVGLYPRDDARRVPIDDADRLELGYWLHVDATGHGYATEASSALLAAGETLPGVSCFEIRCDPRNAPSAAVPRRLGFAHQVTVPQPSGATRAGESRETMIWVRPVQR
jgi:RimJ/RimL family protein N-acetyltransferase